MTIVIERDWAFRIEADRRPPVARLPFGHVGHQAIRLSGTTGMAGVAC
jgi:hypothetical protein